MQVKHGMEPTYPNLLLQVNQEMHVYATNTCLQQVRHMQGASPCQQQTPAPLMPDQSFSEVQPSTSKSDLKFRGGRGASNAIIQYKASVLGQLTLLSKALSTKS